jgi:4-hydroxyphenylpyruvate dioxygenase
MSEAVFDNPLGTRGFAFVEFSAPHGSHLLAELFTAMGFTLTHRHRTHELSIYQQNDIVFLVNQTPNSFTSQFTEKHGPCAASMGFLVENAADAYQKALRADAKPYQGQEGISQLTFPSIYGIGDSLLYFVDTQSLKDYLMNECVLLSAPKTSCGLETLDHLTHNVYQGNMIPWADYYERLFNFREIRYFDITGKQTGLFSRALTSPCGKIRIPLNESKDDKSQIAEYLRSYHGEGIQHIALSTQNIYESVERLRAHGISFLTIPDTYYELLDKRLPNHGENKLRMAKNRILIDNDRDRPYALLLQIFTENVIGPIFFEIIQRKGNEGFGEGNFQALFESMELDQVRRGVL